MRRGVFGGSFDPVHLGHLTVAGAATELLSLTRLHFVPARQQPFKLGEHRAAAVDRVAMLRLALEGEARFVLDLREMERDGPSYTVDTLRSIRAECAEDELFLLVGSDAAVGLEGWHEAELLPELATVVVLTRPGVPTPNHVLVSDVLEVPVVTISATEIRDRAARGASIRGMVPPGVADYMESHGLYRTGV